MKINHKQKGLSLIELMISLVVGLILIAAVFNMYAGNVRAARFTEGLQAIQENGRYGVSVMRRGLQLAGYSPTPGLGNEIDAIDIANSSATRLVIQTYQPFDCSGNATTGTDGLAINTYELDSDNNSLTCIGNQTDSTPIALVEGVENFRVLYGVDDEDEAACEPQRYVNDPSALDSGDIAALRFGMLISSVEPIRTRSRSDTFVVLDEQITNTSDRLLRQVFSGAVLLRNNPTCDAI